MINLTFEDVKKCLIQFNISEIIKLIHGGFNIVKEESKSLITAKSFYSMYNLNCSNIMQSHFGN